MNDRVRSQTKKPGMDDKMRRDQLPKNAEVGRDIPDESKERHTEIAVEAGHKAGQPHGDKH